MPRGKTKTARVLSLEIIRAARTALNVGTAPRDVQRRYKLSRGELSAIQQSRVRVQHRDGLGEAGVSQVIDHGGISMWLERPTQRQRANDLKRAQKKHNAFLVGLGISPPKKLKIISCPRFGPARAVRDQDDGGDDAITS